MVEARRFEQSVPARKTAFAARRHPPRDQEITFMNSRLRITGAVLGALLLSSVAAMAQVPVRKASKNGVNSSQPSMNLFGPTQFLSKSGGDVGVATQYICPGQDVADSNPLNFTDPDQNAPDTLKLAGSCVSGIYKFLFQ